MNYRHAYHAGNFADVLKHTALTLLLLHLRKKESPFAVIDTHAGRGVYDLDAPEAAKTGEADEGIRKLLGAEGLPDVLRHYVTMVKHFGAGHFPGSPLIAARLLRAKDRLVAVEKHDEEFAVLATTLTSESRARAIHGDGYRELMRLLPPPERRGVVLIDPPYENEDEFAAAVRALIAAYRRFAGGIYLLWYPVKSSSAVDAVAGELLTAGIKRLLKVELDIGEAPGETRLSATGILVINPPFGFAGDMDIAADYLAACLAAGPGAASRVETLAGER